MVLVASTIALTEHDVSEAFAADAECYATCVGGDLRTENSLGRPLRLPAISIYGRDFVGELSEALDRGKYDECRDV